MSSLATFFRSNFGHITTFGRVWINKSPSGFKGINKKQPLKSYVTLYHFAVSLTFIIGISNMTGWIVHDIYRGILRTIADLHRTVR